MPKGLLAEEAAPRVLAPLLSAQQTIDLTVIRRGQPHRVRITPSMACAFRMELGNADNVNSYSDGSRIMVTRGMMHFVRDDTELAYVIAREMAHAALHHPYRLKSAQAAAGVIDALRPVFPKAEALDRMTALPPFPKDNDALADRLAVRMLKRAGIDTADVIAFWQRLAQHYPQTVASSHTALHPETAYRIAAIEKTLAAIATSEGLRVYAPRKSRKRRRP
jgi:predicted Zn-dependent protease